MPGNMQVELDAFRAVFVAKASAEIQVLMAETEAQQRAEGLGGTAPAVGAMAPGFTLPDQLGRDVSLAELLHKGPVVVVFYRGHWCPYCNIALNAWQRALPDLAAAGASLVAISPQTPDATLTTAEKNELGFPALSDVGSAVAAAYGIAFKLDARLAALYERFGHPLPAFNGTADWMLPVPASFVIGRDGRVLASHVEVDYRTRMAPEQALAALAAA